MKILKSTTVTLLTFSAGLGAAAVAAPKSGNPLVNAYGEPAGFGKLTDQVIPDTKGMYQTKSDPRAMGMYIFPGTFDIRNFESLGSWQARHEAESRGTVTIGPLEILDSGPTGPMTPEAQTAATAEVTAQVLNRIQATDKLMASLKRQSKSMDEDARRQFKVIANTVAERRQALRESLKTVRAADDNEWSDARTAVAVNFNTYVQAQHRAEDIVSTASTSS